MPGRHAGIRGLAEELLDKDANIEMSTPGGNTALMVAAMFTRTESVERLLSRGANGKA
ncbi:hypothetical protein [Paraburkholderia sp. RL18-103-BIB-C]|uniref:hypothetical protein n=1 Tax=Paraburkholderia sp. RL18-103-BIB-C TaxID=3031637 RepID=UPI0038B96851